MEIERLCDENIEYRQRTYSESVIEKETTRRKRDDEDEDMKHVSFTVGFLSEFGVSIEPVPATAPNQRFSIINDDDDDNKR